MTAPATLPTPPPDDNHDVVGWDNAPQGKDVPWHPEIPPPPRRSKRHLWIYALLAAVAVICLWLLPSWDYYFGRYPRIRSETPQVQNMKALCTAQAQYIKKNDAYAISGVALNRSGTLIAQDLCDAFETFQFNGDSANPRPKAGYIIRMLQGDSTANPTNYYMLTDNSTIGMKTWAAIARSVDPYELDDDGYIMSNQYLITEIGVVYRHVEPVRGDPKYQTFLLDHAPANDAELTALGWTPTK